ncbi:MAG TPA: hypothetical protein VN625_09360, partial [Desulfuromonadaceae bacterium]|nr:hypothetical protein [Desulfuromonadaceae bacterium]
MRLSKIITTLALFISGALACVAQGTAFTYQGRLNDGPNPAGGIYDLRFALFDAATNGNISGLLTNTATPITNGLFVVRLDFGNQFPGANRWLEIAVRTNGGSAFATLTPRQAITSTPYAMQAANVATGAVNAASIQDASITSVKIGDNQVVRSVNGLQDNINLINGGGISIVPNSLTHSISLSTTGGGGNANQAQGSYSFIGSGQSNTIAVTSVGGGIVSGNGNDLSGLYSLVGAGQFNTNSSNYGAIAAGIFNQVSGPAGFIGGGYENSVIGDYAGVVSGFSNRASGYSSAVGGGLDNNASGAYSAISGGGDNTAENFYASVLGGNSNHATGIAASVLGGSGNEAAGDFSVAAGRFAHATQARSFVFNALNSGLTSSVPDEILLGADRFTYQPAGVFSFDADALFRVGGKAQFAGPVYAQNFIGDASLLTGSISNALTAVTAQSTPFATNAGTANRIAGDHNLQAGAANFIGAGQFNTNTGDYAAIDGGGYNTVTGTYGFVGGGTLNGVSGLNAAAVGGMGNNATASFSTVLGGDDNLASGGESVVAGGQFNVASGVAAATLGGINNEASGYASVALGQSAHAIHPGSFVWSGYGQGVTSSIPNEVVFAASQFTYLQSWNVNYSFSSSGFNIGGNAQVTGNLQAGRFIGDGGGLSNITTSSAIFATSAGSASTASSFSGSLTGEVTGGQTTTVVSKILGKPLAAVTPGAN